jgi:uncharacterized membrane protein YbhN (UPF0104 family)
MQLPRSPAGGRNPVQSRVAWWLAWAAATAGLLLFARTLDLRAVLAPLRTAHPGWLAAAMLANFAMLPLLTEQWWRLLPAGRPVRRRVLGECVALALAGMNTLPFGGGHALGVGLLATRAGLGLDGALSLMALEQLCEGLAKISLLLLALAVAPLPVALQRAAWLLGAILLAGSAALLWLTRRPTPGGRLAGWRARWTHHLEVVNRPGTLLAALALGALLKTVQLAAIYAVQRSLSVALPLPTLALVLTAVSFATMVAVAPGNLVVYEAAAFAIYRWLGVPPAEALALALVQHASFLVPMILPGYALTAWRGLARPPAN